MQPAIHAEPLASEILEIDICRSEHILAMRDVRPEQEEQLAVSREIVEANADLLDPRFSWVALAGAEATPVAAWGVWAMHPKCGTAWALFTLAAAPWAIRIYRATLFHMEHRMHRELGYHRLQCTIDSRDEKAHRWARILHYQHEATMRCYGPEGEDHHLMARVWT